MLPFITLQCFSSRERNWSALQALARKVQTAQLSSKNLLPKSLFDEAAQWRRTQLNMAPIMPNLGRLSVICHKNPSVTSIFLSPTVTHLEILADENFRSLECSMDDVLDLCVGLGARCPNLTDLKLSVRLSYGLYEEGDEQHLASLYVMLLQGVKNLRNFTFDWWSEHGVERIVHQLATLPSLETFNIRTAAGGSNKHLTWNSNPADAPAFPALRYLNIRFSASNLDALLTDVSPDLKELVVGRQYYRATVIDLGKVLQVLPRFGHLTVFDACVTDSRGGVTSRDFHFLRYCTSLRTLRITSNSKIDINEEDLRDILSGLPRLTDLEIKTPAGPGRPPHFTLGATAKTVASCPLIKAISLFIDATEVMEPPSASLCPSASLRHLNVQRSPIEDSEMVAKYLAPLISQETCRISFTESYWYNEDHREKWAAVGTRMGQLVRMRNHTDV